MGHKHGGQAFLQESVAQLRQLDRAACVFCGTIRSRRGNRCDHCKKDTATWDIAVGDIFQHRRQPGDQDAAASPPNPHQTPLSSQPVPAPFRTAQSATSLSQSQTGSCSPTSAEPQQWPFRAALYPGTPPRGQRALKEPSVVLGRPVPISLSPVAGSNSQGSRQNGKQAKSMNWLEECWSSSIRDLFAGEKELCNHKLKSIGEEDLAP